MPQSFSGSWKTWERKGPPELAVEIISPNEGDGIAWEEKLVRYHELGVKELTPVPKLSVTRSSLPENVQVVALDSRAR